MTADSHPPSSPYWSGDVGVTDHARERWGERTSSDDSTDITAAWQQATRLPERAIGESADELRVYVPERVVLVRCDTAIVSVLATEGEAAEPWLVEIVYETVGNIWGAVGCPGGQV